MRTIRPALVLTALTILTGSAHGLDLTGTYADKGSSVPDPAASGEAQESTEASLHALMSLDFQPGAAQLDYADTVQVQLIHGGTTLEARFGTAEGKLLARAEWDENRNYVYDGDALVLNLRSEQHGDDSFALRLTRNGPDGMLLVEVTRRNASVFGPIARPVGMYIFHALSDDEAVDIQPERPRIELVDPRKKN